MNVVLCRVDSRLIHGQVVTKWVGQYNVNRIIVVSDQLEKDQFMRSIYLMAAPPDVKVECLGIASLKKAQEEDKLATGRILLILPDIATLKTIVDEKIYQGKVQIGGLGGGPDRKVVFQNITLNDSDAQILEELKNQDCEIYFQTIPEDAPQSLEKIIEKYRKV
ncbi:PTS Man IIB [Lactobacillus helsingborgensis]|uniref:PTS sugar transporter subunit IIB n=1 Tax=Lactobacillus helsingborgensis TaxID=1218494 RepID=A0AA47B5B5_9LACO|nr:PTS sugar transporter subunit IIB [Lactobacillus helsingborgensis]KJY65508.1 PTS Man IIB [Lactobacillus helsingborgensis]UZX30228.1 PTS sugar transporter subunit IIB [Lactobacillus helsingborgensis]